MTVTMSSKINNVENNMGGHVMDTRLTKVFVGGLAWETPKEALKEHFHHYGQIVEAVVISDKLTGRSKGYGFVTFKDAEAANKACEDPTPVINGRRANCNLAAHGGRRLSISPSPKGVNNVGPTPLAPTPNPVQWYYPPSAAAAPFHHHHHLAQAPFYGYAPTYIPTSGINYNHKIGFTGGPYVNGPFSQVYPGQTTLMPMYSLYNFYQSPTMGLPAHMFPPTTYRPIHAMPPLISNSTSFAVAPKSD